MNNCLPNLNSKKIWIDFDNSPHVPLFLPIIEELRKRGNITLITARDAFETLGLLNIAGVPYTHVGKHCGKNLAMKLFGYLVRSAKLYHFAKKTRPSLALSHGARSQMQAASLLGIPIICMFDYEHTKSPISLPVTKFIIPDCIPDEQIKKKKLRYKAVVKYRGLKEDIYAHNFCPDSSFLKELNIDASKIVVTLRPPASQAHYHNPESDTLFNRLMDFLLANDDLQIIYVPRARFHPNYSSEFPESNNMIVPKQVLNGLNLIWYSDLVISGGGTMNREAAALGVPAYSIFQGKTGAVDQYLSEKGKLVFIKDLDDIKKIKLQKRERSIFKPQKNEKLINLIVEEILAVAKDER
jgi:predicted glycosyltransferase